MTNRLFRLWEKEYLCKSMKVFKTHQLWTKQPSKPVSLKKRLISSLKLGTQCMTVTSDSEKTLCSYKQSGFYFPSEKWIIKNSTVAADWLQTATFFRQIKANGAHQTLVETLARKTVWGNKPLGGGSKKYSPNLERLDLWAPVFQSEMLNRWKGLPLYVTWFIYFQ